MLSRQGRKLQHVAEQSDERRVSTVPRRLAAKWTETLGSVLLIFHVLKRDISARPARFYIHHLSEQLLCAKDLC